MKESTKEGFLFVVVATILTLGAYLQHEEPCPESDSWRPHPRSFEGKIGYEIPDTTYENKPVEHIDPILGKPIKYYVDQ